MKTYRQQCTSVLMIMLLVAALIHDGEAKGEKKKSKSKKNADKKPNGPEHPVTPKENDPTTSKPSDDPATTKSEGDSTTISSDASESGTAQQSIVSETTGSDIKHSAISPDKSDAKSSSVSQPTTTTATPKPTAPKPEGELPKPTLSNKDEKPTVEKPPMSSGENRDKQKQTTEANDDPGNVRTKNGTDSTSGTLSETTTDLIKDDRSAARGVSNNFVVALVSLVVLLQMLTTG